MTSRDLGERFGVSYRTIQHWRRVGVIPPPFGSKRGPGCYYGQPHIEAIIAWQALHHHFVSGKEAIAHCREKGITLAQYLAEREASVKTFGIGVA